MDADYQDSDSSSEPSERQPAIRLVVGLGNPGDDYAGTRHNVGFTVVNELMRQAETCEISEWQPELGLLYKVVFNGNTVFVLKPMAFMNCSGPVVGETMGQLGISPRELLVVCDDLDLTFGRIRLRDSGRSGGHKGVGSIVGSLGTEDFPRLKLGIGRPRSQEESIVSYVLEPWTSDETASVASVVGKAVQMIHECVAEQVNPQTVMVVADESDKVNAESGKEF